MQKNSVFLSIMLLAFFGLNAQKFTISGYVSDRKTQENIIGAIVYDVNTKKATTSNAYGFYSLTLPSDSIKLYVSYIGFAPQRKTFFLKENLSLNIDLVPDNELKTVEVIASESEGIEEKTQMSTINIPIEQMR